MARYKKEVVICYDSDKAGIAAADRAIPILRNEGLEVKVLAVPNGKDPDEFIKNFGEDGPLRFKKLVNNSKNDIEYKLQKVNQNFDKNTVQGKIGYLKEAVKILCVLDNNIELDVYTSKLSEEVGIEKSSLLQQIKKERKKRNKKVFNKQIGEVQTKIFACSYSRRGLVVIHNTPSRRNKCDIF
jgi:DNA primase